MSYEPKTGEGTLFFNDRKRDGKSDPSYRGYIVLPDGRVIGFALWPNKTQSGKTLLRVKLDDREGEFHAKKLGRPQMTAADTAPPNNARATPKREEVDSRGFDLDDEIPF